MVRVGVRVEAHEGSLEPKDVDLPAKSCMAFAGSRSSCLEQKSA